ncbi:MAG: hypothetical protein GJ676_20155 [Rhodobacteraceae bacterium]|nr:hypothetical protein [Paracoccaceae bacterium]
MISEDGRDFVNGMIAYMQSAIDRAADTASNAKLAGFSRKLVQSSPLISALSTSLFAYVEEAEDRGNITRAQMKALLEGTTALTIGVLAIGAGTALAPASLVFVGSAILTAVTTSAFSKFFDVISDSLGLFYDRSLDLRTAGGPVFYEATSAADKVRGSDYSDKLFGQASNDRLEGRNGADLLDGGTGNDRLFGGNGRDELIGGTGEDYLKGGKGNDILDGGTGQDDMRGDAGDDHLFYDHKLDKLYGGSGEDWAFSRLKSINITDRFFDSIEHIALETAEDSVRAPIIAYGSNGDNKIIGNAQDNQLYGRGGDDRIFGMDGDDRIWGGTGKDHIEGGQGDNTLDGGGGDDFIFGERGNDTIKGGSGDDTIFGDYVRVGLPHGKDVINAGSGDDWVQAGGNDDIVLGGSGDDELRGGTGDDTLTGGKGKDTLLGEAGDDTIILDYAAKDRVDAGADDDIIVVQKGYNHVIDGGAGWDIVDLRGLDLEKLDPANFKNIEEMWVDELFVTDGNLNLPRIVVHGTHTLELEAGSGYDDGFLLGGANFDLAEGASVKVSSQFDPALGLTGRYFKLSNVAAHYVVNDPTPTGDGLVGLGDWGRSFSATKSGLNFSYTAGFDFTSYVNPSDSFSVDLGVSVYASVYNGVATFDFTAFRGPAAQNTSPYTHPDFSFPLENEVHQRDIKLNYNADSPVETFLSFGDSALTMELMFL